MEYDNNMKNIIRIGTRGSKLALAQAEMVVEKLRQSYPKWETEIVILHTQGDKILDKPLIDFGGKGVFITEFEEALLDGRIDLAVHSAKDMPMGLAEGLVIAGVLSRADVRDVLVTRKGEGESLSAESGKMVIGTGSLRRQFQLKAMYPNVQCISIRGNVPTRLQKVRNGECDGVILAAAGLERLGLLEEPDLEYRYFSKEEMVPAGGQGIIAIESRENDEITNLVRTISNQNAMLELETERKILELLQAGCHEAVGVISQVRNGEIAIQMIQESEGKKYYLHSETTIEKRFELAQYLVDSLQSRRIENRGEAETEGRVEDKIGDKLEDKG